MSTVNCPWKSVSPNICAWGKGFNHFSAVVRCEVVFVVVIIWFSGLECSPYAFVPLSTTYHPHSLWKGIASTRTPGQRPSILSHKPDGDMSIQKAPPLSLQYTFTGHVFNSATRVQSVFTATHLCAYHLGATFQTICILIKVRISLESILNMFSTHLNWQLTWRWKSFLAQQYAASIAVIVSGAENLEWALDEACRAYPMMVDIPYMIQVPGTPPRSPCVLHVSFTPYTSIAYFAQDDWLWHAPVILSPPRLVGRVRWADGARSHNAPISALYRHSPDSVRRNQAIVDTSLWPRGARSDVGSSVFRSILHPRISRAMVLSGRAGYWEHSAEMRTMIQFFNDSWKGWPEHEQGNKLRLYLSHSPHRQS